MGGHYGASSPSYAKDCLIYEILYGRKKIKNLTLKGKFFILLNIFTNKISKYPETLKILMALFAYIFSKKFSNKNFKIVLVLLANKPNLISGIKRHIFILFDTSYPTIQKIKPLRANILFLEKK